MWVLFVCSVQRTTTTPSLQDATMSKHKPLSSPDKTTSLHICKSPSSKDSTHRRNPDKHQNHYVATILWRVTGTHLGADHTRLHDQETHSITSPEQLALFRGSISSTHTVHGTFPLLREASSRSLTWVFPGCLAPAQLRHPPFMMTTTLVLGRNHLRAWIISHPYPESHKDSSWNRPPTNTRIPPLPPFWDVQLAPIQVLTTLTDV
jgi:hypothetical protein